LYQIQGRRFSLRDLKKAVVQASGGWLNGFYLNCWELTVSEILEAVELVAECHPKQ
jgi:hypothetical protein